MADHGPEAMLVAGGTDLYPNMKRRQFEPEALVGPARASASCSGVRGRGAGGLTIGAGTTLTAVARAPGGRGPLSRRSPPRPVWCRRRSLRNMGTIGGNLCVDTRCNYYNQTD